LATNICDQLSSGFGQLATCGDGIDYAGLKTIVAGGVSSSYIGQPKYGNCNFALLRELMPALSGHPLSGIPDSPKKGFVADRFLRSSLQYINYMNANVFQPVGVPTSDCIPPAGTNGILSYADHPGILAHGTDWGDWSFQCGSGGWVLSANNIFSVINDLATGNTLLTPAQKKQMFSEGLGWDSAVRPDCPDPNVCKNGDLFLGPISSAQRWLWTYAGVVKCNVPVVVVVNSPLPAKYQPWPGHPAGDIIGLVNDALAASSVPGTPKACP
jgi:hypothetical protein